MGSENDTLRVKAFRIPKEAYRDPADDSIPESTQPYLQTVRSSARGADAETVVVRKPQHVDLRLPF